MDEWKGDDVREALEWAAEAESTIDLVAIPFQAFLSQYPVKEIAAVAKPHVTRRCIFARQFGEGDERTVDPSLAPAIQDLSETLLKQGWEIKFVGDSGSDNSLLVDGVQVLITSFNGTHHSALPGHYYFGEDVAQPLREGFELLWSSAAPLSLLYSSFVSPAAPTFSRELLTIAESQWRRIIEDLGRRPENLFSLPPYRFEELVAELLRNQGMDVELTPRSRDGGKDILAWASTALGRHLFLVECKRYAPDRPVSVALVRALYGVVEAERASGGILVTTSQFTSDAREYSEALKYRLMLTDYERLMQWLKISNHGESIRSEVGN